MRSLQELEDAQAGCPQLADVSALADEQRHDLLFNPDATRFRLFAFHQATEKAALGGVNESIAWMRLLAMIERHSSVIDADVHPYGQADRLRADYIARIDAMRNAYENVPPDEPDGA